MRFFFIKPVLSSIIIFFFLMLSGILRAEPFYWADSVYQTNPVIVSETVPIRIAETAVAFDFPYEPQIIEQRIISTRIVSPPTTSEIKTIEDNPLLPLRQTEKKENPILPEKKQEEKKETKKPVPNHSDNSAKTESSEISTVVSESSTDTVGTIGEKGEKLFPEITFPLPEESERTTALKPPLPYEPNMEQKQVLSAPATIRGQSSGFAKIENVLSDEPLPSPKGSADASAIDPKLYENTAGNKESLEENNPSTSTAENDSTAVIKAMAESSEHRNKKQTNGVNGILLLATIVSVAMLIYAIVIAFDYHQRWIQSLTAQNNRFSSFPDSGFSGDDADMDADFSGNIPLYNGNSNIPAGISSFRSESQYY
jgi:hypothetical protein